MTASWKILGFAGGAVLAGALAACTVTTNGGGTGDDDDLFGDSGADTSTTTDSGTPDTGPSTAACADETYPDGGSQALTFAATDTTSCTTCTDTNCCDVVGKCFQDPTGDCQDLEACLEAVVENPDGGVTADDCAGLHPNSKDLHNNWSDCQTTNCSTQCQ